MNKTIAILFSVILIPGCMDTSASDPDIEMAELKATNELKPCSKAWMVFVEDRLVSSDGQGHGPDIGSDEWKSVIEFKLNVRGNAEVPDRNSAAWCDYVDEKIKTTGQG
ncbi:hypothetical protein RI845_14945 [Thalassotalea nanhaiensis]|uniref:Uncharacterized protein n=1 Tax=Thalassotalea nanhaiensis TaxID=3065648 RepID=A0ABY9TGC3_9GAMM|nr:hypothetical protein RI845_14945 [Colwelliaceae bacterium SQ345]